MLEQVKALVSNKIIMDFVTNEAREKVAQELNAKIGGSTTAKDVEVLAYTHKNIEERVNRYIAAGLVGVLMAKLKYLWGFEMIKVNLNNYVLVKLTDAGLAELKQQHEIFKSHVPSIGEFEPPKTDSNGYSKWQMHDLMYQLGHLLSVGANIPFETEIIIMDSEEAK